MSIPGTASATRVRAGASALIDRAAGTPIGRRERIALAGAMALGALVPLAYLLLTRGHGLAGDELQYDVQAKLFADGQLFYSITPLGEPHPSAWKAPIYVAWTGVLYSVLGESPLRVELVQVLVLAPLTVFMTWLLARRLFGALVAAVAAPLVALYPLAFEYHTLMYSETLAVPATTAVLVLILTVPQTRRVALLTGVAIALTMLIRPSSVLLFAVMVAAWLSRSGWRETLQLTGLAVLAAILVIAPWTARNYFATDGFVPISIQQGAAYGTFNAESANDPIRPYAWRSRPEGLPLDRIVDGSENESEFLREIQSLAVDYIRDNPASVPKAMFWNGLSRFWDIRRPARSLEEAPTEARSRDSRLAGLVMYYPILILAIAGIALAPPSQRRMLVFVAAALVAAAAVIFASIAVTRYRAPIEPMLVVLAAAGLIELLRRAGASLPSTE